MKWKDGFKNKTPILPCWCAVKWRREDPKIAYWDGKNFLIEGSGKYGEATNHWVPFLFLELSLEVEKDGEG